jgi:hypothetical protein
VPGSRVRETTVLVLMIATSKVSAMRYIRGIILAQLKEVTSTCSRLFRASLTISSSCLAILSSIQSAPY